MINGNCMINGRWTGSPARRQRAALLEARTRLDADHGPLRELRQAGRTRVRAGAAHARCDVVEQVLHTRAAGVEVHPRGRDALLEQALARAVERAVGARAGGDGTRRGHAVALLVRAALLVEEQVARA